MKPTQSDKYPQRLGSSRFNNPGQSESKNLYIGFTPEQYLESKPKSFKPVWDKKPPYARDTTELDKLISQNDELAKLLESQGLDNPSQELQRILSQHQKASRVKALQLFRREKDREYIEKLSQESKKNYLESKNAAINYKIRISNPSEMFSLPEKDTDKQNSDPWHFFTNNRVYGNVTLN